MRVLILDFVFYEDGFCNEMMDSRFGLIGLRERAKQLGGLLQIGQADAGGAMLHLQLPVPVVEAADA